jgi:hypothetical protein
MAKALFMGTDGLLHTLQGGSASSHTTPDETQSDRAGICVLISILLESRSQISISRLRRGSGSHQKQGNTIGFQAQIT